MPGSTKRLNLLQKQQLRDYYATAKQPNMSKLCRWALEQFGFSPHRTTVSRIVKDSRGAPYIASKVLATRRNRKQPKLPQLEQILYEWIKYVNAQNCSITGDVIIRKALNLAQCMFGHTVARFSKMWLYRFQRRRGLRQYRLHGESASVSRLVVEDGRTELLLQTSLYERYDIYNMDETGVFYNRVRSTTISHEARHGMKMDKSRITAVLAANADGTDKIQLTFIGKSKRPRCFGNLTAEDLSLLYRNNRKAWMTIAIFSEWIGNLKNSMRAANRSILLVLDNASSHKCLGIELTHVRVLLLPSNTTAWLQPMDAGIIASFKCHYKRRQIDSVIAKLDALPRDVAPSAPKNLFAVDVLTAMEWMTEAWEDVTPETIRKCWNHTGIIPVSSLASRLGALRLRPVISIEDLVC